ncbi:peroxiredoxin [Synechococcus sp. J7-Johnson]|uniref:peroxiredoxin n=1 Tax=Synechococcus sp. J7-Johnson TaxID=2823737 RepID=UPI0020CC9C73|nr:peroxiredoxin [Synechococcus sp. J7-Johnson]MCP9839632.1 peroxiredoxin [Synechococcus sp. J7-Johnson]
MNRRQLLEGALVHAGPALLVPGLVAPLLGWPLKASALGGTLPPLDQPAPDFCLPGFGPNLDPSGSLSLSDLKGKWLALYFYPKDFTGGCTLEARGFQRDLEQFHLLGAQVVGVSADDVADHASFCDSEGLVFPLLSDPGGAVSQRYGSWIAPFSQRHTFLIDPKGVLRARWVAVRPQGHSREVLDELSRLQA